MAITKNGSTTTGGATSATTFTLSSHVIASGVGSLIAQCSGHRGAQANDIDSMTLDPGGGSETALVKSVSVSATVGQNVTAGIFHLHNPTSGTFDIDMTFAAFMDGWCGTASNWDGMADAVPEDTDTDIEQAASATLQTTVITVADNAFLFSTVTRRLGSDVNFVSQDGMTEDEEFRNTNNNITTGYRDAGTAGSKDDHWTTAAYFSTAMCTASFAPSVGDQTTIVEPGGVVWHAPETTVAVGGVTRTIEAASIVWHAPDVAATSQVTRAVGPAEIVWHAPDVAVSLGAVTRIIEPAPIIWHAPDVVASTPGGDQTAIVEAAGTIWNAPNVVTAVGEVTRAVAVAEIIWHAPDVAVVIGAATRVVEAAPIVWSAPPVTVVTGAVTRAVSSAVTVWAAPPVRASITQAQTVVVGVAEIIWAAPEIQSVSARIPPKLPLTVACDSAVTTIACDSAVTTVACDSTVTTIELC